MACQQHRRSVTDRMKSCFIAFFALLMLTSCASPEKDWQLAERDDSKNAYLEFLAKHPNSEFVEQARVRLDELQVIHAWERAEFKDSLSAYHTFLEKHGDSEFAASALSRAHDIQRDDRWETIRDEANKADLESFLAQYPDAPQFAEARSMLTTITEAEEAARPKERPGKFRLQLAAFRTVTAAEEEARRLIALAPEILLGPIHIDAPDQTGTGNMFLLKTVPMTGPEARNACASLKNLGQDCILVNR